MLKWGTGMPTAWTVGWLAVVCVQLALIAGCQPQFDCSAGNPGCACETADTCAGLLMCLEGVCQAADCTEGLEGCPCGSACGVGLQCNALEYCESVVGQPGQPCYANRTCDPGNLCNTSNVCEACSAGVLGCVCFDNGTCNAGLECKAGTCVDPAMLLEIPPADPRCYTPCSSGMTDATTGLYRPCSVDGLMEGCIQGAECVEGSCVAPSTAPPACTEDVDCPDYQACIAGQCYSNCEYDSDCGGLLRCHRKVCRQPCMADDAAGCPTNETCELVSAEAGFCMPLAQPVGASSTQVDGTYKVGPSPLVFSNISPSHTLVITNDSPRAVDFTLRKESHRVYSADGVLSDTNAPMPWVAMGPVGNTQYAPSITIRAQGGEAVEVAFAVAPSGAPPRWDGTLHIESDLGERRVQLEYSTEPDGRWTGKAYYFTQFGDVNLDAWIAGTVPANQVENAFVQHFQNLLDGAMTLREFEAVLNSVINESWKWRTVRENCDPSLYACYPSTTRSNGDKEGRLGLGILSAEVATAPVPAGVVELPLALDLKRNGSTGMIGKIASNESLHYPGNPAVSIAFEGDPATCATGLDPAACVAKMSAFGSTIVLGGRYAADPGLPCSSVGGATFQSADIPWLVPGFFEDTAVDGLTGARYRHECRADEQPFGAMAVDENLAWAAANPIADGRSRVRSIELVRGMVINQERMLVLFRERFAGDFLGGLTPEPFSAYGLMMLYRGNAELGPEDFIGTVQSDPRTTGVDLAATSACDPDMLARIGVSGSVSSANASSIATVLLTGLPETPAATPYDSADVFYSCDEQDPNRTDFIGGGGAGATTRCSETARVTYFYCGPAGACDAALNCSGPDCAQMLSDWIADPNVDIDFPVMRCADPNSVYCDADRTQLTLDKVFYPSAAPADPNGAVLTRLETAIDGAFRYKTQFQSRTGSSVGFAPEICQHDALSIPYCYDPAGIEEIRDRVDCLTHIFTTYYGNLGATLQSSLRTYLSYNFAFAQDGTNVAGLPVAHDGFERLSAELLIMLGDDAYTRAFQSRFDLAGSANLAFEGSLFEPNGIDLSGIAGYEMYTLYQAQQYYGMALDRFFSLTPYLNAALGNGGNRNFVTLGTATAYLDRVLRASTQRARAAAEIARRYQLLNRADLARRVVSRAYASAYLESVVIGRLLEQMVATVDATQRDQVVSVLETAAVTYRISMLDMRELFGSLTDEINYFGFTPDYIPMPALDPSGANSFETLMARAHQAAQVAAEKEDLAIGANRSYETDAAAFQSELTRIRNTYENQLAELCGTMEGEDGRFYPATRKYAYLNARARALTDPCGLMGNGAIHEAIASVDLMRVDVEAVQTRLANIDERVVIENERYLRLCGSPSECSALPPQQPSCGLLIDFARVKSKTATDQASLRAAMRKNQRIMDTATRTLSQVATLVQLASCNPPGPGGPGNCGSALSNSIVFGLSALGSELVIASQGALIEEAQAKLDELEVAQIVIDAQNQCDTMSVELDSNIRTILLEVRQIELDALRAEMQIRLSLSRVQGLRQQAARIEAEQSESEQLAINLEAARNDPNVRIYKNDAVLNAERTFNTALRETYRATRVFEYYTSQSYMRREELSLVRLVSRGLYSLEGYLADLEEAYYVFNETYGRPDMRVEVISLRDDILGIPRYDAGGVALCHADRIAAFRDALRDPQWLNPQGHLSIPFATSLARLSPLTRNHKIAQIEVEIVGSDVGDGVGRVYLSQGGTGMVRPLEGMDLYYRFPERTAVINPFFNGMRTFIPEVYLSRRLRDRPYVNTGWEIVLNQRDEVANQDVDLSSLTDIRLYVYYTDFTAL